MNLEMLAAFRGEAWAKRVLNRMSPTRKISESVWPGKIAEARKLAGTLGRPQLVEALAVIIQERAAVAWRLYIQS
jgi:hypothetical protein